MYALRNLSVFILMIILLVGCGDNKQYKNAKKLNTIEGYEEFIGKFPESKYISEFKDSLRVLYYKKARNANTVEACENFLKIYPEGKYVSDIKQLLLDLRYHEAIRIATNDVLKKFLKDYPNSQYSNEIKKLLNPTIDIKKLAYQAVKIGNQIWMLKNLDVSCFRNGDPIPEAKTNDDLKKARDNETPVWCYYNFNPQNGEKYGKLYNWHAVTDSRGLAPKGWHVPSDAEWTKLTDFLGGENSAGPKMKSIGVWNDNSINNSGFSALPGGYHYNFHFTSIDIGASFWSSTKHGFSLGVYRALNSNHSEISASWAYPFHCFSVRCIKD